MKNKQKQLTTALQQEYNKKVKSMQEGIWEPDLYYILLYGMACVDCNIYL